MTLSTSTLYQYQAFGLNILSDTAFEQLAPGNNAEQDTIEIRKCDQLPNEPEGAQKVGPFSSAATGYMSLDVDNIVRMVACDGQTLFYCPHEDAHASSLQVFLLGAGLGTLLMQRKLLVLQGNAIEIDGTGIIFIGTSGVGKSTVAAGLMHRGYRTITDDICAIDAQNRIIPGAPNIELWQEAAKKLEIDTQGMSQTRPQLKKFRVPLGNAFCADRLPVTKIYALSQHQTDAIECTPATKRDKFLALQGNTYRLPFVEGMKLGPKNFQLLASLGNQASIKRLHRPQRGYDLDRLLDFIIADATNKETAI